MRKIITDRKSPLFDEFDYQRSCSSKKKYSTAYQAQFAIDECKAKGSRNLSYYRCPYCDNYHLTGNN